MPMTWRMPTLSLFINCTTNSSLPDSQYLLSMIFSSCRTIIGSDILQKYDLLDLSFPVVEYCGWDLCSCENLSLFVKGFGKFPT